VFINIFAIYKNNLNMKKVAILLSLSMLIGLGAYAQKNKRTSAYMYNKNQQYDKAKEAIDEAINNEKTMNDAKTWMYRGEIYYNIAASQDSAVRALAPDAKDVAFESLKKAKQLDEKNSFEGELELYFVNLTNLYYQQGSNDFGTAQYGDAIKSFEKAFQIAQLDNRFDTIAAFNIGMAGVLSDNPDKAVEYLQKCAEVKFDNPRVYLFYNRALKQQGDTVRALEVIKEGREIFPDNLDLLLEEAQIYLEKNETAKLLASLQEAVKSDTANPNLFFLMGKSYDDLGDKVKAEENYRKAAKINPQFFEAYYNIGAIYVNKASELQAEANDLPLNEVDKYNQLTEEANKQLSIAVPSLEKALELRPDDAATLNALKEAYARLKMNDKLKELNQK